MNAQPAPAHQREPRSKRTLIVTCWSLPARLPTQVTSSPGRGATQNLTILCDLMRQRPTTAAGQCRSVEQHALINAAGFCMCG